MRLPHEEAALTCQLSWSIVGILIGTHKRASRTLVLRSRHGARFLGPHGSSVGLVTFLIARDPGVYRNRMMQLLRRAYPSTKCRSIRVGEPLVARKLI